MYKQDLALNKPQGLYAIKHNQTKPIFFLHIFVVKKRCTNMHEVSQGCIVYFTTILSMTIYEVTFFNS